MNIGDIILNGISSIPISEKKKIINFEDLMDNNIKKDFSSEKYISQNKQNIIDESKTYQIFKKNNSKNVIANLVYIGINYFITIFNHKFYLYFNNKRSNFVPASSTASLADILFERTLSIIPRKILSVSIGDGSSQLLA